MVSSGKTAHAEFAVRFRQALREAGHGDSPQKELARLFGVTGTAVRKWKEGEAMPSSKRAPQVAHVLGVRRAWLLDGEHPIRPHQGRVDSAAETGKGYSRQEGDFSLTSEEFRLVSNFRKLNSGLRRAFSKLLEESVAGRK